MWVIILKVISALVVTRILWEVLFVIPLYYFRGSTSWVMYKLYWFAIISSIRNTYYILADRKNTIASCNELGLPIPECLSKSNTRLIWGIVFPGKLK